MDFFGRELSLKNLVNYLGLVYVNVGIYIILFYINVNVFEFYFFYF